MGVCPTEAIQVADLDDADNAATRIIARDDVAVRAPEQNTKPKVFYRGADQASLDPTRTAIPPDGMIWAETTPGHPTPPTSPEHDPGIVARTTYTTSHPSTWDRMVSGYLATKAVAGGVMIMAALMVLLGHADDETAVGIMPPVVAGVFLALTAVLLVGDLKQPGRFFYLLTRSNWSSWLVKGAYVLGAFALGCAAWFVAGVFEIDRGLQVLAIPVALLGAATAGYTAYLFAQCEGRDLWQTPLLLPMLLARAVVAGAAAYAIADLFMDVRSPHAVWWSMLGGIAVIAFLTLVEIGSHGSRHVEMAVHSMTSGQHAGLFRAGVIVGLVIPAVALIIALAADFDDPWLAAVAGLAALAGVFFAETAFVRAGQSVPLS